MNVPELLLGNGGHAQHVIKASSGQRIARGHHTGHGVLVGPIDFKLARAQVQAGHAAVRAARIGVAGGLVDRQGGDALVVALARISPNCE